MSHAHRTLQFNEKEGKFTSFINILDVLGPNMMGLLSSHTVRARSIGLMVRKLLGEPAREVEFILYGSFTKTYKGHGTGRALLGGIMGSSTDGVRIPNAYDLAGGQDITWTLTHNEIETELHSNTVDIHMTGVSGETVSPRDESIGGGKIRIMCINGIEVDLPDEYNTLIAVHRDCIGMAAHITSCLGRGKVNIAFMKLFWEARGDRAYNIVKFDGSPPEATQQRTRENRDVENVMLIQIREVE